MLLTALANSWIHHDYILLVVIVEIVHKLSHLIERKPARKMSTAEQIENFVHFQVPGVQCKHFSPIHVINIGPHGLQGNPSLAVIVDNLSHIEDIAVAISTLVELFIVNFQSFQSIM